MNTLRFLAPLFVFCPVICGLAADARMVKPQSVELQTIADPQFGPITIRARASEDGHVESLSITYKSHTINVPADGLRDLRDADIASLNVTVASSDPAKPWLQLNMSSRDPKYMKAPGQLAIISFVIDRGEVVRRSITWASSSGGSLHDDKVLKPRASQ